MKKNLYIFGALVAALSVAGVHAAEIGETEALRIAQQFRGTNPQLRKAPGTAMKLAYKAPASQGNAFYVFNNGENGGFTIVAGNDVMPKILGFSETGHFNAEDMPSNLRAWLDGYVAQADYAIARGETCYEATRADNRKEVPNMLSTVWDQSTPFNDKCPTSGGRHALTGCVATAMSQVMKYYEWPPRSQGKCHYNNRYVTLSSELEWDRMIDSYKGNYSNAQAEAVATLMFDAGRSVDMVYGTFASGALSEKMQPAMINNFDYDMSTAFSERKYYSDEEWEELMYNEIAAGRPVLYGGVTANGEGHQFVLCGYKTGGYFYVNWGWSGDSDGYFLLDVLTPSSMGSGGGTEGEGFNYDQDALFHIQKPCGGKQQIQICGSGSLSIVSSDNPDYDTFKITRGTLYDNDNQQMNVFANFTGMAFTCTLGARVTNLKTGEVTDRYGVSAGDYVEFEPWSSVIFSYPVDLSGLADGRYTVYPYSFTTTGDANIVRCPNNRESYMIMDVENGKRKYYYPSEMSLATSITVSPATLTMKEGETAQLTAQVAPQSATQDLLWTSSAETVATVDNNGLVTAKGEGNAVITVATTDGSELKATSNVTVEKTIGMENLPGEDTESVTVVTLDGKVLLRQAAPSELKKLPEGIYLVNGRKVLVK